MTLTSRIATTVTATASTALDLATSSCPMSLAITHAIADGTGNGKADLIFHDTRTLSASATENLDLAGVLADPLGATLTFAKIKAIIVTAASANTNNVLVGGAASNGFVNWVGDASDIVVVQPGGSFILVAPNAGYAVTAGTGDILKMANSAGSTSVTYSIVIIGASA